MTRIGIIGCGQLARMLAMEGTRMGLEFAFVAIGNEDTAPIESLINAPVLRWHEGDDNATAALLAQCDVVTTERENVPQKLLELADAITQLKPNRKALSAFSRRDHERDTLTQLQLPVAPFAIATRHDELLACALQVGFPVVIKTVCDGYDGKGQWRANDPAQLIALDIDQRAFPLLIERCITFTRELSITAARSSTGEIRCYPLAENRHVNGILVSACAPAACETSTERLARTWASYLLESLDYVGVLTIELFDTADGLLINEIAPRVHNSAHWTLGGAMTSQFENHLRAITGAPLGATSALGHCGIVNVLGKQPPAHGGWMRANTRLHHYAKTERAGRKLGHVLVMDAPGETVAQQIRELEQLLAHNGAHTTT